MRRTHRLAEHTHPSPPLPPPTFTDQVIAILTVVTLNLLVLSLLYFVLGSTISHTIFMFLFSFASFCFLHAACRLFSALMSFLSRRSEMPLVKRFLSCFH